MISAVNIASLRDTLREQFPAAHAQTPTHTALDFGIPCLKPLQMSAGTLSEIVTENHSAGSGLLLLALIEAARETPREPVAMVDAADTFDPTQVSFNALERLLWVRCRDVTKAIRAADLLLRDGNIPRVLLDLQFCSQRMLMQIPSSAWHRLRMLAEKSGVLLCVFSSFKMVPSVHSRLFLDQPHTIESQDSRPETLLTHLKGRTHQRSAGWGMGHIASFTG